ncbi:type I methionyl aminopeptidase [Eggerthellaceae bacterium zg-1084]|uniref:Methionine aminopeptidase n=1 Tax=Berryella wangjianweii TaxID=2734634 RepID=A0A6M8J990_9ACTN|nr:type I methionyl aminopeptidase [Berryella wangjianweii]NPD31467.1 type I methionyl aminopeptidase [Berryella wangjianweii]NPD33034.1 type I methionyl aminopeptidase [Eggerthellaceae bacterium zg-997]QKF07909.1 type I methionyl aminopeptidase [Berryella wangjianweii]
MIIRKTSEQIKQMRRAGSLSAQVLREVGKRCVPGVTTLELDRFAEDFIRRHGGVPTFKGLYDFPATLCTSVNEEVVHGIPSKRRVLREGDVVSIDTGATVGGWAGDNAWTFAVGKVSPEVRRLLQVTERSMWAGIRAARIGSRVGAIGHAVSAVARKGGLGVVREYTGHGVGRSLHEDPAIPNWGTRMSGPRLQEGMVIAIEPMLTLGSPHVIERGDGWTAVTRDGLPAAHFEKTIAVTAAGPVLVSVERDHVRPLEGRDALFDWRAEGASC